MNGADLAGLLQQAMAYRQANRPQQGPQIALGNQSVAPMQRPGGGGMFINPMTAVQPAAPATAPASATPAMAPQVGGMGGIAGTGGMSTGGGGGMDLAGLLQSAQQFRQNRRGGNNSAMVNALRRSAMGEY